MKIRILTSCTSDKTVVCPYPLTRDDFQRGPDHLERRQEALAPYACTARDLYAGRQHRSLMRGVQAVRGAALACEIEVFILSAGFGLVPEDQVLVPYDVTFSGMNKQEIRAWADTLSIPAAVRRWLETEGDLNILLLGDAYLEAAGLEATWPISAPTILFCGTVAARVLPDWERVRKVVLSRADAKRLRQGLVWLKGYLAARLLDRVCNDPDFIYRLFDPCLDVVSELSGLSDAGEQLSLLDTPRT